MGNLHRFKPSPSMIVSMVALFVALGGGAYAGVALNQVRSVHIKNNEVRSVDLRNGDVRNVDLQNDSVNSAKIADGSITTADLAPGTVSDLNDASTVGGLSVAQIVAATGGQYFEARQTGSANIAVGGILGGTPPTLATLTLPAAGKYLVNASMHVQCTWDATGLRVSSDTVPPGALAPHYAGFLSIVVDGTSVESRAETCEVESLNAGFLFAPDVYFGSRNVQVTRQIETTGPATVTIVAGASGSGIFGTQVDRVTATGTQGMIQAVTVRT